jgi:hypothetical protein
MFLSQNNDVIQAVLRQNSDLQQTLDFFLCSLSLTKR